jgi:hypothetical protein
MALNILGEDFIYGKETSAISPKGKKAASRFAAVTIGAKPPT